MEPTLEELYSELIRDKRRLLTMDEGEKAKFSLKMVKALRLAIEVEQPSIEGHLRIVASHISLLPSSLRKTHALKSVTILENHGDPALYATSLENLAALNEHEFKDPTIESIVLLQKAIEIRSASDDYDNLLDMVWAQQFKTELEEE